MGRELSDFNYPEAKRIITVSFTSKEIITTITEDNGKINEMKFLLFIIGLALFGKYRVLAEIIRYGIDKGVIKEKISEALLTMSIFSGWPATLNALHILSTIAGELNIRYKKSGAYGYNNGVRYGEQAMKLMYGKQFYETVNELRRYGNDFENFIFDSYSACVGDALTPKQKELIATFILSLSGMKKLLEVHIKNLINNGASPKDINSVYEIIEKYRKKMKMNGLMDKN